MHTIRPQVTWYRHRPLLAGTYGVIVVAAVLAFLFLQPPDETRFWDAVFDVGHACLFGLITFIVLHVIDMAQPGDRGWHRTGAAVALVAAAGCSELVQRLQPTRDPSWDDVFRDVAGIACAYLLYLGAAVPRQEGRFGRRLIAVGTALAIVLGAVLLPFAAVVRGYAARDRIFPALCVLDGSEWERPFVRVTGGILAPAGNMTRDDREGSVRLTDLLLRPGRRYVGLALDEPFPDWLGYQKLVFTASIDVDDPLVLFIRIRDRGDKGGDDDSFMRSFQVTRSPQTFEIALAAIEGAPRGRRMDLGRIGGLAIFFVNLRLPVVLRLGDVRLR